MGKKKAANRGGPFMAASVDEKYSKQLLSRSDRYIRTIKKMPLGPPMKKARITSGFGRRSDPFNRRLAFHAGIDFRGKIGDKILATADGVIKKSAYDKKGLGHYVTVRHGNGYETVFGHMSKRLLKKGDKVRRGQVVGLMGNTGRSTGPHLHYEIRYRGKAVDPKKYLSVAKLSFTVPM
ncbi:MAG: M23 family metallopeptidase [Candidatus Electrothrix sp. AR3]|nr:M23 family metallopeptidase [Candidatus Electrothrix sp. AR3]